MKPPKVEKVFTNKRGVRGASVRVEFDRKNDRLPARYRVLTHGLTVAQVQAKIDELKVHHAKRAARYFGFDELRGQQIGRFVITTATIRDRGTNVHVRLVLADGSERVRVDRVYKDCDAVPTNQQLRAMAEAAVLERELKIETERQYAETLAAALGGEV